MPIFITIFISIFLYGYTPQLSAIAMPGVSTDGATTATFYGSASSNLEEKASFSSNDSIDVKFSIEPDIADQGKFSPIYMVRFYNNQWLMKNEQNNWVPWDLNFPNLERAEMRILGNKEVITVDSGLTGLAGKFHFYVGYGLPSGGVVYNSQSLQFDVFEDTTASNNKAILGPLTGADVKLFKLSDLDNPIAITTTDQNGSFDLDNIQSLNDNYYLISVTGGIDIDADDDGNIDANPTNNQGTIYGLISGSNIKKGNINVTAISDIAWRYIESNIHDMSNNDIQRRLTDIAKILFASDISGDNKIDEFDLVSFNPQNANHKQSLNFNYQVLFDIDNDNDSIISTYHNNKVDKLKSLLESKFGNKLSFYTTKDSRSDDVKVKVIPFGKGSFSSDLGDIDYDSDRDVGNNQIFSFYKKTDSSLTITATPKADTEILSWEGCDSVNSDKSQCKVSLNSDHQISVSFGYKETEIVDNLVDLTRANVTLYGNSIINVTINQGDDELVTN